MQKLINFFLTNSLFVIILGFTLSVLQCSEPIPAEEQINLSIQSIIKSIEKLDDDALEDLIPENIEIKQKGQSISIENIKRLFLAYRFKKQSITINVIDSDVQMDKYNTHLATVNLSVLAFANKGLLPRDGKLYKISSQWRLINDQWVPTELEWQ